MELGFNFSKIITTYLGRGGAPLFTGFLSWQMKVFCSKFGRHPGRKSRPGGGRSKISPQKAHGAQNPYDKGFLEWLIIIRQTLRQHPGHFLGDWPLINLRFSTTLRSQGYDGRADKWGEASRRWNSSSCEEKLQVGK